MSHIKQTISGDKVIARCERCGEQLVIKINSRDQTERDIKNFTADHKHPGKDK